MQTTYPPPSVDGRVPPHDLDAEAAVLSAVMLDTGALAKLAFLSPEHFYSEAHRRIYEAARALHDASQPVDIVQVGTWLKNHDRIGQIGGMPYLTEILNAAPAVANVAAYGRTIHEKYRARQIIATCQRTAAMGYLDTGDPRALADDLLSSLARIAGEEQLEALDASDPLAKLPRLRQIAMMGRAQILALASKPIEFLWEGIASSGQVVLIAGGPGGGKTTLLFLLLAARMSMGDPVKVLGRLVTPAPAGKRVVLVEGEHGDSSTARKLTKSLRILDVGDEALNRVIVLARKAVRIGSPEWEEVETLIAAGLVSDIALDTLARVAPGDGNDEREQVAIFDRIAAAIERAPSSDKPIAWTIAHTRKDLPVDASIDDVSGSTQRSGQADTVIIVRPERDAGRVVSAKVTFVKLREDPEDDYPMPVEFALVREGNETRCQVTGSAARTADPRPAEVRILEELGKGERNKEQLKVGCRLSGADVEGALSNLFANRSIRTSRTASAPNGRAVKFFAVAVAGAHVN